MKKESDERSIDKSNMFKVMDEFPNQCSEALKTASDISIGDVNNVIITGMGGSGIGGDLLATYLYKEKLPIFVSKDYELPKFANKKSLIIISSYSGNTEEAISCFKKALNCDCKMLGISSNGKIKDMCKDNQIPFITLPKGFQPRCALAYGFFPMLKVLENSKLIESKQDEIANAIVSLKKDIFKDMGKDIADKLVDKIPLIYSSERFRPVAYRWKTQFNENAKLHAFYHIFPELNHNELNAYLNLKGNFCTIILKDEEDHERVKKRMRITKDIIRKNNVPVVEIGIKGDSFLSKLLSTIYVGDWASYFLALNYKIDPTPVRVIEDFKKQMG